MNELVEKAREVAIRAHEGQFRLDGSPYFTHPERVAKILKVRGFIEELQALGYLHDTPEDCPKFPIERLEKEYGFENGILTPLRLLTKSKEIITAQQYQEEYIEPLSINAKAREVKKTDLFDNSGYDGMTDPGEKQNNNLDKYSRASLYLARFAIPDWLYRPEVLEARKGRDEFEKSTLYVDQSERMSA